MNNKTHVNYRHQTFPDYRGNPFIEALPEEMDTETAIEMMSEDVLFNENERKQDVQYRMQCISRLFRYFQPIEHHVDIERRISRCIRQGYLNRSPLKKGYAETLLSGYEAQYNPEGFQSIKSGFKPTSIGFTIIGMSGVGKSTAVERILELYPQVIRHTRYNERNLSVTQITWIKLDCPHDGSIKSLCYQFFDAIDRILETGYLNKHKGRGTIDILRIHMAQLASLYSIGVLVIDEIQHLSLANGGGSEKMLNFLVTLVNTIGIPIVLIGTTKAKAIVQSAFRQARRSSGQQGDLLWDRMKKDVSWDIMVASMWKYQWTKHEVALTQSMKDALYDESQGIIDIAIKLYAMVQMRAIATSVESFTAKDFKVVASEKLSLVKPMLDALRSGDRRKIEKFEDISPISIDDYLTAYANSASVNIDTALKKKKAPISEQATLKLLELGVEPNKAKFYIGKVMATNAASQGVNDIIKKAYRLYMMDDTKSETSTSDDGVSSSTMTNEHTNYDTLKKQGLIDTTVW